MRIMLIMFFVALCFPMNGEEYRYFDKKISEEKFADFYHYFKNYLFVDNDGKVYDIRRNIDYCNQYAKDDKEAPVLEIFANPNIGDYGIVSGEIMQVIGSQKIILNIHPRLHSWVAVNVSTNGMYDEQHFTAVGIVKRTYSYITVMGARKTLPEIDLFDTLTISIFKKYIENNPLVYYRKKIEIIPAEKQICSRCNGKKKIQNPNYNRKSIESKKYIECPNCQGSGMEIKRKEKQREIFEQCIVDLKTKLPEIAK